MKRKEKNTWIKTLIDFASYVPHLPVYENRILPIAMREPVMPRNRPTRGRDRKSSDGKVMDLTMGTVALNL